jgi:hypothetical protein
MFTLRRRLRLVVAAWLVLESASLSALVARDCCRAHRVENAPAPSSDSTTAGRRCHELAAAHCPMHAEAQPACPMHKGAPPDRSDAAGDGEDGRCVMRGVCSGPMDALAALMTQSGVLPDFTNLTFAEDSFLGVSPTDTHPILRSFSPDTPPPKFVLPAA